MPLRTLLTLVFALSLAPVPALAAPALPTEAEALKAFLASDSGKHIVATGHQVQHVVPLNATEVLVVDVVPEQSEISFWDNEARLVLFEWTGGVNFRRKQFVSKAGESLSNGLGGLLVHDIDHDGQPEIVAVSKPSPTSGRVVSMVFRRGSAQEKYQPVWERKDLGAALMIKGDKLLYTYVKYAEPLKRRFEEHALESGAVAMPWSH